MKLLFKLVVNTSGYGFVSSQFIVLSMESISQKRNTLVAEKFVLYLFDKNGKHTVYTDDGTLYPEARKVL